MNTLKSIFALCMLCGFSISISGTASAEEVEITLVDNLDGDLSSYCLDIVGSGRRADPDKGLQAHTCYSYRGDLGIDQIFDSELIEQGRLYMPRFDVCAQIAAPEIGAGITLADCTGGEDQRFTLAADGTISPASQEELCFTAGTQTRLGRGGTSRHQIKTLSLALCDEAISDRQSWRLRSEDD